MGVETTLVRVPAHECERGRAHVDVGGVRWQGPDGGPVIVCVHGLGGSHLNWLLLGPRLAAHATVWAPDLAGFGRTELGERSAGLEDNLDLLRAFVRTVSPGRPVVLAGHSLGGLIACTLAGREPQLVAGLLLLGPAIPPVGGWPDPIVLARFAVATVPVLGESWLRRRERWLTPAERVRESLELNTCDADAIDPAFVRAQVRLAAERRTARRSRTAVLTATRTMIARLGPARRRFWSDVAAVSAPTLVLHGALDRLVDERAVRALAARRPDWRLHVYADLGHMVMVEDAERVVSDVSAWLGASVGEAAAPPDR